MTYTPEQLSKMSDDEVELAYANLIKHMGPTPRYCTDWSATGPLMVERGISLISEPDEDGDVIISEHKASGIWSDNTNPLRSICEVLLQLNQE